MARNNWTEPVRSLSQRLLSAVVTVLAIGALASALLGASIALNVLTAVARPATAAGPPRPVPDERVWRLPLDGTPVVVRGFDPPPVPWLPGHRGVDLAGESGGVVRAAGPGMISFAGHLAGRGVVSVQHEGGLRTTYLPVAPTVRVGQRVAAGDLLGLLEPGHGAAPTVCLHWGLRTGDRYLDPLLLLRPAKVRLFPVRPGDSGN